MTQQKISFCEKAGAQQNNEQQEPLNPAHSVRPVLPVHPLYSTNERDHMTEETNSNREPND